MHGALDIAHICKMRATLPSEHRYIVIIPEVVVTIFCRKQVIWSKTQFIHMVHTILGLQNQCCMNTCPLPKLCLWLRYVFTWNRDFLSNVFCSRIIKNVILSHHELTTTHTCLALNPCAVYFSLMWTSALHTNNSQTLDLFWIAPPFEN